MFHGGSVNKGYGHGRLEWESTKAAQRLCYTLKEEKLQPHKQHKRVADYSHPQGVEHERELTVFDLPTAFTVI